MTTWIPAGTKLTAAVLNTAIDTAIGSSAWTAYTPTWTTTGTAPAVGNGTLTGAYRQVGKTVYFRLFWLAGTTTTFGTGSWMFSLPVAALASRDQLAVVEANDASGSVAAGGGAIINNANGLFRSYIGTASAGFTNAIPWTWANGDSIRVQGVYEAA